MHHVYILRCRDGSYYVGSTNDVETRLLEHQNGTASLHTRRRRPVELVFQEGHPDLVSAVKRERQLKNWSREKKEALIAGDLQSLRLSSRSRD